MQLTTDEHARLTAFDNDAEGVRRWPLGPNRGFRRRDDSTFVVEEWTTMGVGRAYVTTRGTASLRPDHTVDVVVRNRGSWIGWLLILGGLVCFAVAPRDGVGALLLGVALVGAGWFLYVRSPFASADLDDVEAVLRQNIAGEWRPRG